ncbi:d-arabinitol dehydrogenase [Niveomyces insectorum RCEF 264]|uniref:D-arabinitol dehydrogenase n=1 Tax=Niveomyces insectorum RCEF 264 TaxID=1081102 RepID=A0A162J1I7_9HYPO|nr:d-arabinitol dehydrogenase [Niveomyces insectorum RCEF 264]
MFAAACARSVRAARGVPLARFTQRAAYSASSTIPAPIADADLPLNPPAFSLAGRRVLITGGARGLGLAMGQAILASGADVALSTKPPPRPAG